MTFSFFDVFLGALLARLGWELGTNLLAQLYHQMDRLWSWIHDRQAQHRAREEAAGFYEVAPGDELALRRGGLYRKW